MESLKQDTKQDTTELLIYHWSLDKLAADYFASRMDENDTDHIHKFLDNIEENAEALSIRDSARSELGKIYSGESEKQVIILGPCSLDVETDYAELFSSMKKLQQERPEALIVLRANGAKPRTNGKWRGMHYSTDVSERERLVEIYKQAFEAGIPIVTEVTNSTELGAYAPYLSGYWLGARDMMSTDLRAVAGAYHLAVAVKNGLDGETKTVQNTIEAIRKNTYENEGSGIEINIASTPNHAGIASGVLPVGEGNKQVGIIARGYSLPERMSQWRRKRKVAHHIGKLCLLADEMGSAVLIDGSHEVPPMLKIKKSDGDRFPKVMHEIVKLIHKRKITNAGKIVGFVVEASTTIGKTDKNYIASPENMEALGNVSEELEEARQDFDKSEAKSHWFKLK
jgi:phospho-2-dehydro-3-deoxyheptonate aldolase